MGGETPVLVRCSVHVDEMRAFERATEELDVSDPPRWFINPAGPRFWQAFLDAPADPDVIDAVADLEGVVALETLEPWDGGRDG
jgi:uncharacterized protein YbjT (DUF2867 family)